MSRFLLPISRNWIGAEFYGSKYALSVASPHTVSPFLYVKCVLFASNSSPAFPSAAAYCNAFLQALHSGAVDGDLVQYIEHFDRASLGASPGLRQKDENELKIVRTLSPMQHRVMLFDGVKAAVYLCASTSPEAVAAATKGWSAVAAAAVASGEVAVKDVSSASGADHHESGAAPVGKSRRAATGGSAPGAHRTFNRSAARDPQTSGVEGGATSGAHGSGSGTSTSAAAQSSASAADATAVLGCLAAVFPPSRVADLDALRHELGLSPDVVIKAFQISMCERALSRRKEALFSA